MGPRLINIQRVQESLSCWLQSSTPWKVCRADEHMCGPGLKKGTLDPVPPTQSVQFLIDVLTQSMHWIRGFAEWPNSFLPLDRISLATWSLLWPETTILVKTWNIFSLHCQIDWTLHSEFINRFRRESVALGWYRMDAHSYFIGERKTLFFNRRAATDHHHLHQPPPPKHAHEICGVPWSLFYE